MSQFVTEDQWEAIGQDLKGRRPPVTAIVSFIGATGDTLLALRKGDRLVCNADEDTVRIGLTNPETLQRLMNKKVRIFSVRGLHAKVIVGDGFAWVGSANASDSGLLEATIRVDSTDLPPIGEWADSLCDERWELTAERIKSLLQVKVRRVRPPRPPIPTTDDLASIKRLQLWWMDDYMSPDAEEYAEREIKASSVSRRESEFMNSLSYTEVEPDDTSIQEGEWLVPFYEGQPSAPAQVMRTTLRDSFKIIWFQHARVVRIPTLGEIEEIIPEWWDRDDEDAYIFKSQRKLRDFLALYS